MNKGNKGLIEGFIKGSYNTPGDAYNTLKNIVSTTLTTNPDCNGKREAFVAFGLIKCNSNKELEDAIYNFIKGISDGKIEVEFQYSNGNNSFIISKLIKDSKTPNIPATLKTSYNSALIESEEGRANTNTNYIPYGNKVGVEIKCKATIMDIISSPTYAALLGRVSGNVFKTGIMNPQVIVFGFGHQVQGLNIGDIIDIAPVPNVVTIKGAIAGSEDYVALHKHYADRNPKARIGANAANVEGKSIYLPPTTDKEQDKDDVTKEITFSFKGLMDPFNIEGVYINRKDFEGDK